MRTTTIRGDRETIGDDDIAVAKCKTIKRLRAEHNLKQADMSKKLKVSASTISRVELYPELTTVKTYNMIAAAMNWPLYQRGRKFPGNGEGVNDRQVRINYEGGMSPAEALDFWLKSVDGEMKSRVKILADFYHVDSSILVHSALKEYINARRRVSNETRA